MRYETIASKLLLVIGSTLLAFGISEGIVRVLFEQATFEKHLDYGDTWRPKDTGLGPGGFLKENFSGYVEDGFGGTIRWKNNSVGFRNDKEFTVPKPPNTIRILSLGDSFTAGYRVGQEQTFSFLLEEALAEQYKGHRVEVIISAIRNPFIGLQWLKRYGVAYQPDLVMVGLTLGNDITQVFAESLGDKLLTINWDATLPAECLADQLERQTPTPRWSTLPMNSRPSILESHLVSMVKRIVATPSPDSPQTVISDSNEYKNPKVFESHALAYFLGSPIQYTDEAYQALFKLLETYKIFAAENNLELLFVIFPQRFQVQPLDWKKTVEVYGLRRSCFDLELPNRLILLQCDKLELPCLDPTREMRDAHVAMGKSLYLPNHDMHWGIYGHKILAEILYHALDRFDVPLVSRPRSSVLFSNDIIPQHQNVHPTPLE